VRFVRGSIDELLDFGQEPLPIGSPAPRVEFKGLGSEKTITLASLAGEKVVLKFWSTGCGPCLKALDKAYGPSSAPVDRAPNGRVLLVSIDDDIETSRQTFASRDWTGGEFVWGGHDVSRHFRLPGLPCTVVIDAEGRLTACVMGSAYEAPGAPD
jgi:thiol-disulfide isomerase/thioredoxin